MESKKCCLYVPLVFGFLILVPSFAWGWIRERYLDPVLVERAELIVVAHIKDGSIVYVPHTIRNGGMSWEHHGALLITEIIKGISSEHEIPIIFHYGLDPLIAGGRKDADPHRSSSAAVQGEVDQNSPIIIYDVGGRDGPVSGDIRKDQIWFLRVHFRKDGTDDRDNSTDKLGLWEPQDIQPLELKPYFQTFLTDHPEQKLKEFAGENTLLAIRSKVYLDHLKIEEILKEPDANKRADSLLPFCLYTDEQQMGPTQSEAMFQMWQSCGKTGVARFVPLFNDPKYEAMQFWIINEWDNAQYQEAIPILIELLQKENKFWRDQTPAERDLWVDMHEGHSPTMAQIMSRRRVESVLMAFKQLADPRAKPILVETKQLWDRMFPPPSYNNFDTACDDALMRLQNIAHGIY